MNNDAASNYLERKILDHILGTATFTKPTSVWLALHTADPTDAAGGAEVTGGGYQRQQVTFSAAATAAGGDTTATNTNEILYSNMPSGTVTHFSVYDAQNGGNMLVSSPLDAPKTQSAGDQLGLPVGQLTVQAK